MNAHHKSRRVRRSLERAWLNTPSKITRRAIRSALVYAWAEHAEAKARLFASEPF